MKQQILRTLLLFAAMGLAQAVPAKEATPGYDATLAQRLGADDYGMRSYVLVILRTGPSPKSAGPERDEMFKGHFANMQRLAKEGKLVLAGPFAEAGDWRGLFIFDVKTVDEAKALTATDPVIATGEMVAEYRLYYGSAALKLVNEAHEKIQKKSF
jgi:uncharacterized protein YciI